MSNTRYIEFDSTYRDRNLYPFPAEFAVMLSQSGIKTNSLTSLDPLINSYPFYPGPVGTNTAILAAGTTPTNPIFDANAEAAINNFYINDIFEKVTGPPSQFSTITFYDAATKTATISPPIVGLVAGDMFRLRKTTPIEQGFLTGGTLSAFILPLTSSSINNFYTGQYIWITSGAAVNDVRRITSYVGVTRTGTVSGPFSAPVVLADGYEILQFSGDNSTPMVYTGSTVSQQEMVCYEIECISLILPNILLYSGVGGRIAFYPYVYVEISNLSSASSHNKNIIYSNNPNSTRAIFRCPVDDIQQIANSQFVKIDSDGMKQTIKFKPNDNLFFRVTLQNGELFKTMPDNFFPLNPNPKVQISACFSIKRL